MRHILYLKYNGNIPFVVPNPYSCNIILSSSTLFDNIIFQNFYHRHQNFYYFFLFDNTSLTYLNAQLLVA